jgi:hypothetical protein
MHNPVPSSRCSSWRETRGLPVIDRDRQPGSGRRQLLTRDCAGHERSNPGAGAGCPERLPEGRATCGGGAAAIISRRTPRGNAQPILAFPSASRPIINLIHDRTLPP